MKNAAPAPVGEKKKSPYRKPRGRISNQKPNQPSSCPANQAPQISIRQGRRRHLEILAYHQLIGLVEFFPENQLLLFSAWAAASENKNMRSEERRVGKEGRYR